MTEETAARIGSVRRAISRRMVRTCKRGDGWWARPIRNAAAVAGVRCFVASDGPYQEFQLVDKLIGRVVGIYCPAALAVRL